MIILVIIFPPQSSAHGVKVFDCLLSFFNSTIDLGAAEAVVDATHRYKEIFYGDD